MARFLPTFFIGALAGYYLAKRDEAPSNNVCFTPVSPDQLPPSVKDQVLNYAEGMIQTGGQILVRRIGDAAQIVLQEADGDISQVLDIGEYYSDSPELIIDVEGEAGA